MAKAKKDSAPMKLASIFEEEEEEQEQDSALSQTMATFVSRINGSSSTQPIMTPWAFGNGYI